MAALLKSFSLANVDNALVAVYTCPASTAALVHNMILCNISGATINVDVTLTRGAVVTYLAFAVEILAGASLIVLGDNNKQVLEAGEILKARATAGSNVLDVTGAVLEQSV